MLIPYILSYFRSFNQCLISEISRIELTWMVFCLAWTAFYTLFPPPPGQNISHFIKLSLLRLLRGSDEENPLNDMNAAVGLREGRLCTYTYFTEWLAITTHVITLSFVSREGKG